MWICLSVPLGVIVDYAQKLEFLSFVIWSIYIFFFCRFQISKDGTSWFAGLCDSLLMGLDQNQQQHPALHTGGVSRGRQSWKKETPQARQGPTLFLQNFHKNFQIFCQMSYLWTGKSEITWKILSAYPVNEGNNVNTLPVTYKYHALLVKGRKRKKHR